MLLCSSSMLDLPLPSLMSMFRSITFSFFFFFNDTATTEIYTLSLHDALPICATIRSSRFCHSSRRRDGGWGLSQRSEEHTSELQSRLHLVCRLLLEKKKKTRDCLGQDLAVGERDESELERRVPALYSLHTNQR